ncbi:MAG: Gmad2 immunoglobulin-like domain-containing protein [bacterium]|nr:Gmad2 immunoglobulin-like domain-containing protein [bacterium]
MPPRRGWVCAVLATTIMVAAGCGGTRGAPGHDDFTVIDAVAVTDPLVAAWVRQNSRVRGVHVAGFDAVTYVLATGGPQAAGVEFLGARSGTGGIHLIFGTGRPGPATLLLATTHSARLITGVEYRGGQPLTEEFPLLSASNAAIIVTWPLAGSEVSSPVTVKGFARVFEATFRLRMEDGHDVLADACAMASEGAPGWGEFEVAIEFNTPSSPGLQLFLFEESAKDGSPVNVIVVPLLWAGDTR